MDSSAQASNHRNLETASALRVKVETGSHLFKIFGYSLTKGSGFGKFYRSGVFTIGGYDWVIEYYPDGFSSYGDEVIFYLRLKSEATDVKARVTLTILEQNGVPSDMSRSDVMTFESTRDSFSYSTETSKFEASGCLKDDAFTVKCTVSVVKGFKLEVIHPDDVIIPHK